jgi:hypothetical protein
VVVLLSIFLSKCSFSFLQIYNIKALARNLEKIGSRRILVTVATTTGTLQAEGTHTPAMYAECIRHLGVSKFPNGVFVDGTFGRGGHTRKILEAMGPSGELHAFDMDPEAIEVGKQLEREDARFHIHHAPFSSMYEVLTSERYKARLSQCLCPLYPSLIHVFAKILAN